MEFACSKSKLYKVKQIRMGVALRHNTIGSHSNKMQMYILGISFHSSWKKCQFIITFVFLIYHLPLLPSFLFLLLILISFSFFSFNCSSGYRYKKIRQKSGKTMLSMFFMADHIRNSKLAVRFKEHVPCKR